MFCLLSNSPFFPGEHTLMWVGGEHKGTDNDDYELTPPSWLSSFAAAIKQDLGLSGDVRIVSLQGLVKRIAGGIHLDSSISENGEWFSTRIFGFHRNRRDWEARMKKISVLASTIYSLMGGTGRQNASSSWRILVLRAFESAANEVSPCRQRISCSVSRQVGVYSHRSKTSFVRGFRDGVDESSKYGFCPDHGLLSQFMFIVFNRGQLI
jgi:hypothetical protein